jgi:site-specific DNA-methyltransferase (adenine-specific)
LPKFCLMLHGIRPDLVVYDPFIGAGTTASACINLDVKFVGTEIDEQYVRIARDNVIASRQRAKEM